MPLHPGWNVPWLDKGLVAYDLRAARAHLWLHAWPPPLPTAAPLFAPDPALRLHRPLSPGSRRCTAYVLLIFCFLEQIQARLAQRLYPFIFTLINAARAEYMRPMAMFELSPI